jgi:hypothetical protein
MEQYNSGKKENHKKKKKKKKSQRSKKRVNKLRDYPNRSRKCKMETQQSKRARDGASLL